MPSRPTPSRLLVESLPIAALLFVWTVVSLLTPTGPLTGAARDAGSILAALYAVVRGVQLAGDVPVDAAPGTDRSADLTADVGETLAATVPPLLAGGAWLLVGSVFFPAATVWDMFGLFGLFTAPLEAIAFVSARTALAVVLLYAVAVGLPAVRAADRVGGPDRGVTGAGVGGADRNAGSGTGSTSDGASNADD